MSNDARLATLLAEIRTTFDADFDPLDIDGQTLHLLTVRNMPQHLDSLLARKAIHNPLKDLPLWAKVWPGSFLLGRLLRHFEPEGKTLLEIGAGCGVLGLVAARYGFRHITVSDIVPEALQFAQANVWRNGLEDIIDVAQVDVAAPGVNERFAGGVDIIAASEILYLDELHRPLIKFRSRHLAKGGKAVFCTDTGRAKPRFAKNAAKYFKTTERRIGLTSHDAEGQEQHRLYDILVLERP